MWRDDDAPALIAACNDPEIVRWLPAIPSPYGEAEAREYLEQCRLNWDLGQAFNFAIVDEPGELLGSIAMRALRFKVGHIGYWIAPWARRRRAATRAVVLLSQWALGNLEMERISLLTFPGNVASEGVAAAAGYTREGVLRSYLAVRGERRDTTVWSLIAADLEA